MDISKQRIQLYGHDTTCISSILLENLIATILVFLVTNASIKKSKYIFSVYIISMCKYIFSIFLVNRKKRSYMEFFVANVVPWVSSTVF